MCGSEINLLLCSALHFPYRNYYIVLYDVGITNLVFLWTLQLVDPICTIRTIIAIWLRLHTKFILTEANKIDRKLI